jgi:hypothetical protein
LEEKEEGAAHAENQWHHFFKFKQEMSLVGIAVTF